MGETSKTTSFDLANGASLRLEAYKRSSMRLESQQAIAIASDQRALVAAGASVAAAAFTNSNGIESVYQLIAITCFVLSAICAISSAKPQNLFTSGSTFGELSAAIEADLDFQEVVHHLGENNDEYIQYNEKLARERSHKFLWCLNFFAAGAIFFLLHVALSGSI